MHRLLVRDVSRVWRMGRRATGQQNSHQRSEHRTPRHLHGSSLRQRVLIRRRRHSGFRPPSDFIRTSSFLPLRVVAFGLTDRLHNFVHLPWANRNRRTHLEQPAPYYYAIRYDIRAPIQLLGAHRVSISLLQFRMMLFQLLSN
jgi:hypothetical protein